MPSTLPNQSAWLEEGGHHSFAITCGIYGRWVHTAFASSLEQGLEKHEEMKRALELLLAERYDEAFYRGATRFMVAF